MHVRVKKRIRVIFSSLLHYSSIRFMQLSCFFSFLKIVFHFLVRWFFVQRCNGGKYRKGALDYHIFSLLVRRNKYSFRVRGSAFSIIIIIIIFLVDYQVK